MKEVQNPEVSVPSIFTMIPCLKSVLIIPVVLFSFSHFLFAEILEVGKGRAFTTLQAAAKKAKGGDTILIRTGVYPGGEFIANLKGNANARITICAGPNETVIFRGGAEAIHLSDPEYVTIKDLIFEEQTSNSLNIDDAGSYETPAHHINVENCHWIGIKATGNNDEIKISGVEDFVIKNCEFKNGSPGGSLIDMVGCHRGRIEGNLFENAGSNSIQAKGGTSDILIRQNKFLNGGERAINIGGSTGLPFFRPLGIKYEASSIKVHSNIIIGGIAPIAFVGAVNSEVINNTIIKPENWAIRILQETTVEGFLPCGKNVFRNNIVVTESVNPAINIGPGTDPKSFTFSNNLWFNPKNQSWTGPDTPVKEENQLSNLNPLLIENTYRLKKNSPAIEYGYAVEQPALDFSGKPFAEKRAIGALEFR